MKSLLDLKQEYTPASELAGSIQTRQLPLQTLHGGQVPYDIPSFNSHLVEADSEDMYAPYKLQPEVLESSQMEVSTDLIPRVLLSPQMRT